MPFPKKTAQVPHLGPPIHWSSAVPSYFFVASLALDAKNAKEKAGTGSGGPAHVAISKQMAQGSYIGPPKFRRPAVPEFRHISLLRVCMMQKTRIRDIREAKALLMLLFRAKLANCPFFGIPYFRHISPPISWGAVVRDFRHIWPLRSRVKPKTQRKRSKRGAGAALMGPSPKNWSEVPSWGRRNFGVPLLRNQDVPLSCVRV